MIVALQPPLAVRISPGKITGVGCHALLQGIFPTQGSNTGLLHCRQVLYRLSQQESPTDLLGAHSVLIEGNTRTYQSFPEEPGASPLHLNTIRKLS